MPPPHPCVVATGQPPSRRDTSQSQYCRMPTHRPPPQPCPAYRPSLPRSPVAVTRAHAHVGGRRAQGASSHARAYPHACPTRTHACATRTPQPQGASARRRRRRCHARIISRWRRAARLSALQPARRLRLPPSKTGGAALLELAPCLRLEDRLHVLQLLSTLLAAARAYSEQQRRRAAAEPAAAQQRDRPEPERHRMWLVPHRLRAHRREQLHRLRAVRERGG
mmetsp:Transcript_57741/g.151639  ORF Transcript_57741/g.151639 Transcript_57741/m.151639 type:complete len:223 (+) Transcript_57741:473-1141(+)